MVDSPRDDPDEHEDGSDPDASRDEKPVPPPLDINERSGGSDPTEPIAMPAENAAEREKRKGWHTTIDDLIPLPQEAPYHDDDAANDDPYDATDAVDRHVPPATGDAARQIDDFSTGEELGVDNAPAGHNPEHETVRLDDAFRTGDDWSASETAPLERGTSGDPGVTSATTATATVCPICGRSTEALRFCGHCGSALTEDRHQVTGDTQVARLLSRLSGYLAPFSQWTHPGAVRAIFAGGAVLILLALLANSGALALVISAAILPTIILYWCRRLDVFESEPWYIVAGFGIVGVVIGALLGWLGAFTVTRGWFDTGVLNFGAAGFGGQFAGAAGTPPFMVWLICGLVVPGAALAAVIASPLLSKQVASLGNEVMDGLTIAAAIGGGFAIGTAIVFVAPMFGQDGPAISASGWTLTTIGLTVVRPLIWTLASGMIGAAAWRYLRTGRLTAGIVPGVVGIAAPLAGTLLSLQLSTIGLWAEVVTGAVIAIAVAMLYQRTLADAIREDRRVLGTDDSRTVCPHCHRVTPVGTFCAHCGQEIATAAAAGS